MRHPFLAGKVPNPKDVDPKVLKDLMDKLNKMPKDQQPDKAQIEEMLPALLARFHSLHPGVDIRLRQAGTTVLLREVVEGKLELAFASVPDPAPVGLIGHELLSEAMMPSNSPVVHQDSHHGCTRRRFLLTGAGGIAGATLAAASCRSASGTTNPAPLAGVRSATPADLQNLVGDGRKRRILLRGAAVLSLDPEVGDAHCPRRTPCE